MQGRGQRRDPVTPPDAYSKRLLALLFVIVIVIVIASIDSILRWWNQLGRAEYEYEYEYD
jgi:hypothetical protein